MIATTTTRSYRLLARSFNTHYIPDLTKLAVTKRPTLPALNDYYLNKRFSTLSNSSDALSEQSPAANKWNGLKALDIAVVRQIKSELMEVDANSDGRLDANELKRLLHKHNTVFTDSEILEIGELFYSGKSGGSVSFDRFIAAVDHVASRADKGGTDAAKGLYDGQHFKTSERHPLGLSGCGLEYLHTGRDHHGHYTEEELAVKLTHVEPKTIGDKIAFNAVKIVRFLFDSATGWRSTSITVDNTLNRVIYLETVAAVPGMVAAIIRHFKSLRTMERDGGMLQMFLEEANNERMHLLTFVRMKVSTSTPDCPLPASVSNIRSHRIHRHFFVYLLSQVNLGLGQCSLQHT
mmetsp:Transcript_5446/g.7884  ORF Transcript_5446/g.7884 Transcript_5446/m.7884 type:complete len:349 (-) Transcript_5446:423-1469(-)